MPTPAQQAASRANGAQSFGPITPAGRRASSRNSTKHGYSGNGSCLPPEMEAQLQAEVELYNARHQPRDDYERDLVRRAALGNLRARHLSNAEFAQSGDRIRTAVKRWDETRADEVAALAKRLDAEPADALRLLTRTAEGCDHLADAWDALAQTLDSQKVWDEPSFRRALRLLGLDAAPSNESPEPLRDLWLCVLSLRFAHDPAPLMATTFRSWTSAEAVRRHLPEPATALTRLRGFAQERIAEYESLGETLWNEIDAPARNSATTRAAFDAGPEAARLHRYLNDAERMRRQALEELARHRRDESRGLVPPPAPTPARNEPEPTPAPARNEPQPPPSNPLPPTPPARNEPQPTPVRPVVAPSTAPAGPDPRPSA